MKLKMWVLHHLTYIKPKSGLLLFGTNCLIIMIRLIIYSDSTAVSRNRVERCVEMLTLLFICRSFGHKCGNLSSAFLKLSEIFSIRQNQLKLILDRNGVF